MYICKHCASVIPSHTPSFLFTQKTRTKTYPHRPKVQIFQKDGKTHKKDDPGGTGFETVREIQVCASCYGKLNK